MEFNINRHYYVLFLNCNTGQSGLGHSTAEFW